MTRTERCKLTPSYLKALAGDEQAVAMLSFEQLQGLIFELQFRQIELEKQNSELLNLQNELEVAHNRHLEFFNLVPVGYVVTTESGRIVQVNQAAANLLQMKTSTLIDQSFTRFISYEDQDLYYFHCQKLAETHLPQTCEIRLKQGKAIFYASLQSVLIKEAADNMIYYLMVINDITTQKQTEIVLEGHNKRLKEHNEQLETRVIAHIKELYAVHAKLSRVTELKNEFLANMNHELRTPLNAILGNVEILKEQVFGLVNANQQKALAKIENNGKQLLTLFNDILDLSKMMSGQFELLLDKIPINTVCQSSVQFVQAQVREKQIELNLILDDEVGMVEVDKRRLTQVLVHLLTNAIKFTPKGGLVELTVNGDADNGEVKLAVRDTGIGIAKDDFAKIFKRFVQLDASLERPYEGIGRGLSLASKLVELHGGSIAVTSKVGHGSCFTITLPWYEKNCEVTLDSPQFTEVAQSSTPQILVVEDSEVTINTLYKYLILKGYQVIIARDGIEALNCVKTEHPDLILMDIQIPRLNGIDVIHQIRANPEQATLPIIALTGIVISGEKEHCLEIGANDYFSKPVNLKQLMLMIEHLLRCVP